MSYNALAQTEFWDHLKALECPSGVCRVLELGTKRWYENRPTHHADALRDCRSDVSHIRTDIELGRDVDVVADAHDLSTVFGKDTFDAVLSESVFEHLERPWVAAESIARVVRPGGLVLTDTLQTFPIHGYPQDYFRFSTEAMKVLFGPPLWEPVKAWYSLPCVIDPPTELLPLWNRGAPAYLHVLCVARRTQE